MIPPLLNDFIGLQKDTVLVSFIGVVEIFRQSQIRQAGSFNFTPYMATAIIFVVVTIPLARFTDWLVARDRRRDRGGRPMSDADRDRPDRDGADPADRGPAQVLRGSRGPARDRPRRRAARGRLPHRLVGERQVDAAALHQPPRADRRRADLHRRARDHRPARRRRPRPPGDRHRLPGVQPVPAHVGPRQRDAGAAQGPQDAARPRPRPRPRACSSGSAWPTSGTRSPTGCRAASSSAWRSSGRSRCSPSCCCSTR